MLLPSIVAEVTVALAARASSWRRSPDPDSARSAGPRVRLAAGPALRHRPARGAAQPGRDRPDRTARDRARSSSRWPLSFVIVLVAGALRPRRGPAGRRCIAVGSAVCGNTAIVGHGAGHRRPGPRGRLCGRHDHAVRDARGLPVSDDRPGDRACRSPRSGCGPASPSTTRARSSPRAPPTGPDALDVATVVKLIRNALMAPLLFLIAAGWAAPAARVGAGSTRRGPARVPAVRARVPRPRRRCGRSG